MSNNPKPNVEDSTFSLDDTITQVGARAWTAINFMLCFLCPLSLIVHLLGGEFIAPNLNFNCKMNKGQNWNETESTSVNDTWKNDCYYFEYNTSSNGEPTLCQDFEYDTSIFTSTLTSQFDLVCRRAWIREVYQMVLTLGSVCGCILGGVLANTFGCQKVAGCSSILCSSLVILIGTIPDLATILVLRFVMGITYYCLYVSAYILGMECCPIRYRAFVGISTCGSYAIMTAALGVLAYFLKDWQLFYFSAASPIFITLFLSNPMLLLESPRWLLERGRIQEAEDTLRKAAALNRTSHRLPEDLSEKLNTYFELCSNSLKHKESFRERLASLCSSPPLAALTTISMIITVFSSFIFISLPLRSNYYQSSSVYMMALGIAELPGYSVTVPLADKLGRKRLILICSMLTAFMFVVQAVLSVVDGSGGNTEFAVAVLTCIFSSCFFMVRSAYVSELYPTSVRSIGTAIKLSFNSLGYSLPPLLLLIIPDNEHWISLSLCAVMALSCAGLIQLLPEMKDKPLLQTTQQYQRFVKTDMSSIYGAL